MTVPDFDASKHHVGLGGKGLMIQAYTKTIQRVKDQSQDIGGGRPLLDDSVPERSFWNQDSFIGGAFQYRVTDDKERFAECTNLIPQLQDKGCISIPPLILKQTFNPLASMYTGHINTTAPGAPGIPTYVEPRAMFPVAGSIYMLFKHGLFRWRSDDSSISFWAGGPFLNCIDAQYDYNDQIIYVALDPAAYQPTTHTPHLARVSASSMSNLTPADFFPWAGDKAKAQPDMEKKHTLGLHVHGPGGSILMSIGNRLWTIVPNKTVVDSSDSVWTEVGRLPGKWIQSHFYNGRVYIMCGTADAKTHIVSYDGTAILPVAELPWNFEGWDITSYGGRQFAVGRGTDVNGADRYGEMHEIAGTSVRLVRTFQAEHYSSYAGADTPKNLKCVAVDDGLLWVSHQGRKLVAYDLTADAFWGASEFQNLPANFTLHKMCRGRAALYGYGSRNGLMQETGLYRVATPDDVPSAYWSTLITSDFDHEIARLKRWGELAVQTRNQSTMGVDYSFDTGVTWTAATVVSTSTAGNEYNQHKVNLATIPASPRIRFRFSFPRNQDTSYRPLELNAFSLSYTTLGSDKWTWSFTVVGAVEMEAYDDTKSETSIFYTPSELQDLLEGWAKNKDTLTFRDINGHDHTVTVFSIKTMLSIIGPRVGTAPEGYYSVTLQEI